MKWEDSNWKNTRFYLLRHYSPSNHSFLFFNCFSFSFIVRSSSASSISSSSSSFSSSLSNGDVDSSLVDIHGNRMSKSGSSNSSLKGNSGHYTQGLDGCSRAVRLELRGAFDSLYAYLSEELSSSSAGTLHTVSVRYKQYQYVTNSISTLHTVSVRYKQYLYVTNSICTLQTVSVRYKQYQYASTSYNPIFIS